MLNRKDLNNFYFYGTILKIIHEQNNYDNRRNGRFWPGNSEDIRKERL